MYITRKLEKSDFKMLGANLNVKSMSFRVLTASGRVPHILGYSPQQQTNLGPQFTLAVKK